MQGERPGADQRLQRHHNDDVEEIGRVRNAPEIKAQRRDPAPLEQTVGLPESADRGDAEQRGGVGKDRLSDPHAFERKRRHPEFEGGGGGESRGERGERPAARPGVQPEQWPPLQRQVEQEAPHDQIDAKKRDPAYAQIPIGRRGEGPQGHDDEDEQDREGDVDAPVAAAERAARKEQKRREQEVEPLLDREAPGDRIEIDGVGRADEVFDIEEIAQRVGGEEIAGHQRHDDQRSDIGRNRAHPPAGEEHPEVAPRPPDHPVDDLGGEHESAENEKHLDGCDRDRFDRRAERRIGRQVVRNRDRKRRGAPQEVQRGAALHCGGA